jgi:hypothetical protein
MGEGVVRCTGWDDAVMAMWRGQDGVLREHKGVYSRYICTKPWIIYQQESAKRRALTTLFMAQTNPLPPSEYSLLYTSPRPPSIPVLSYAVVILFDHDRLIAPRRLSRMCRNAWNPQNTKKPYTSISIAAHMSPGNDDAYSVYSHSSKHCAGDCATVLGVFVGAED